MTQCIKRSQSIRNQSYERFLLNQTNFDPQLPKQEKMDAKLAAKDMCAFDFLILGDEHAEKELKIDLIQHIRKFIVEMGGYFSFIGNQYRIDVDSEEFFVGLLLYHRKLRCLIVLELKKTSSRFSYGY